MYALLSRPRPHHLLYSLFSLLVISYPGHNLLQTIVLNPSPVKSYTLPPIPSYPPYPQSDGVAVPPIYSRSYIVQDLTSKTIIASRSPDTLMLPASTTKLMTALVALDQYPDLSQVLTVKNQNQAIGQTIDLVANEQLTIHSLLYALLVHSGNDAALAIADNYPGGYAGFVTAMNAKAAELHLSSTTYKNPSGIEQYGHVTTARDLAILAGVALNNEIIRQIVTTESITIYDITNQIAHELTATDELLGILPGLLGGKTGWTTNAGECFVALVERGGRKIITVVLGSTDRFGDTTALVDWVYAHHDWVAGLY